ncbi:Arabinose 5-phosphate isomerase KdsD [subsurface metagenome]|nr:MAG: SIS domain-containing protein [Candidatus Atribacteria bacterium 1244-E10-H5-B2]
MEKEELWKTVQEVWKIEISSIEELATTVDKDAIFRVVEMIADCKNNNSRVITMGVGTSAAAARKIAHTFSCIEIPSFFLSPADSVHGGLGAVQRNDIVIAISKGGNTKEIINVVPSLKKKEVKLIGVTENESSILGKECNLLLKVKVEREADEFNMLATSSTIAVISLFDAIAVSLMKYTNYTKEQFAIIHSGGAVGEKLLKEVTNDEKNESSSV